MGHCADRYGVSLTAAALRWTEIAPKRAVLVASRDDHMLWAKSNKAALRSGAYFATRRNTIELPHDALAHSYNAFDMADSRTGRAQSWFARESATMPIVTADVKLTHPGEDGGLLETAWMLTQEEAVEVRVMARQGKGIREIARDLGVSRNTVRRYLRGAQAQYTARPKRPTKLAPYEDYVRARLAAAQPDVIPATVLLRELAEQGYTGGISQLKAFMAPLRRAPADPVVRFETAPGEQMQADFTTVRRGRDRLVAFVATLGYSRATYVRFGDDESFPAWEAGLVGAFDYFGGVPQHVLFDNAKPVLLDRDVYGPGQHRWNPQMLDLAEQCAFTPRVCRPYRARTKGKVERFNGYLKGSFVVPLAATLRSGGLVLDVHTANREARRWLDEVANRRIHGTTQARPCDLLVHERQHLQPLPDAVMTRVLPPPPAARVLPFPSIQHPLSVYGELMEAMA